MQLSLLISPGLADQGGNQQSINSPTGAAEECMPRETIEGLNHGSECGKEEKTKAENPDLHERYKISNIKKDSLI